MAVEAADVVRRLLQDGAQLRFQRLQSPVQLSGAHLQLLQPGLVKLPGKAEQGGVPLSAHRGNNVRHRLGHVGQLLPAVQNIFQGDLPAVVDLNHSVFPLSRQYWSTCWHSRVISSCLNL